MGQPATRLTPQKIAFATALAAGRTQADAAREAGYADRNARKAGFRLMQDPRVRALVEQLQAEHRERNAVTFDQIKRQYDEDRALAYKTENATAAVSATTNLAKMAGLMVERLDARVASFAVRIGGIDRAD